MNISTQFAAMQHEIAELKHNPTPEWQIMNREQAQRMRNQAASTLLRLADNDQHYAQLCPGFRKEFQAIHASKSELAKRDHDWPMTIWVPGDAPTMTDWGAHHKILHHMATWQQTRGVYQFEPELYEALKESDLGDAPLPAEALQHLPQHSVYLDFEGRAFPHLGAYVMLDYHVSTDLMSLSILHESLQDDDIKHVVTYLVLGNGNSLQQALDCARQEAYRQINRDNCRLSQEMYSTAIHDPIANNPESVALVIKLALYLCSGNAEAQAIKNKAKLPPMQPMKKGPRQIPDPKIRIFKVGQEIAQELREVKARAKQTEEEETARTGRKPINPHIRRAHFHTYLLGPRAGEQTRDVRWLPPTNVSPRVPEP